MSTHSKEQLKATLNETRGELLGWAETLREADWTQPVYSHGEEWTTLDVFRHLTWAEGGMARLIQQIRQGEEGAPPDFDLDRYNARGVEKFADKTPAELLEMMTRNRQWVLEILNDLEPAELALAGRHGSGRILSIAQILDTIAMHEQQHLDEMREALSAN